MPTFYLTNLSRFLMASIRIVWYSTEYAKHTLHWGMWGIWCRFWYPFPSKKQNCTISAPFQQQQLLNLHCIQVKCLPGVVHCIFQYETLTLHMKAFILKSPFLWVFGPLLLKNEWLYLADDSVDFYSWSGLWPTESLAATETFFQYGLLVLV